MTRLLHRHPAYGYTTNPAMAAPGEPEALTTQELDDITSRTRRRHHTDQILELKQARAQCEQALDRLHQLSPGASTELRAMQRQLDRYDARLRRRYDPS